MNEFRTIKELVYESPHAQSLTEILLAVKLETAVDLCEKAVRLAIPALILDIDLSLSGLDRTKLNMALQRQRSAFFSAGELM